MERHGGALPASYEQLKSLPGIGEYTAGAIASIAFGVGVPAVDGNVLRVLSRILASEADVSTPAVRRAMRSLAADMLPEDRPGELNQALMELGATVCLPNGAPLCGQCPVAQACAGYCAGIAASLPVLPAKKARRVEARTVVLVRAGGKLLLFRRGKGLLAGMYEPLNLIGHLSEAEVADAVRALGGPPLRITPLGDAKHIFTHIEWRMRGYLADCEQFPAGDGVWGDAGEFAIPSAFRSFPLNPLTFAPTNS
jgi:A/G-specific adenine glycosylase